MNALRLWVVAAYASVGGSIASAAPPVDGPLLGIAQSWDRARYEIAEPKARRAALVALGARVDAMRRGHEDDSALLLWRGIILAGQADEADSLAAVGLAWRAKAALEATLSSPKNAELIAAAKTVLGELYHQVPGFPLGFGDDRRAELLLRQGAEECPNDIEATFYYASYLAEHGRFSQAVPLLRAVADAATRPERLIADNALKNNASDILSKVKSSVGPNVSTSP